jgi:hypothetical protein
MEMFAISDKRLQLFECYVKIFKFYDFVLHDLYYQTLFVQTNDGEQVIRLLDRIPLTLPLLKQWAPPSLPMREGKL